MPLNLPLGSTEESAKVSEWIAPIFLVKKGDDI
jgi:hypothetical protein